MIYIIEDDSDIREMESYALKNSGYDVKAFPDSTDFYQACKNQKPSLILLDIIYAGYLGLNTENEGKKHDTTLWAKIKKYHS